MTSEITTYTSATARPCGRSRSLKGSVTPPGDKSLSHRALIIASQAVGRTTITGLLEGEDVLCTLNALQNLGVSIAKLENGHWRVDGVGVGGLSESADVLNLGNAGTGVRLLMGLVAPYNFTSFFCGDASLSSRPMNRIIDPLSKMGTHITARQGGRLPLAVQGSETLIPIVHQSKVASAQVKSAILLAGLNSSGMTTVIEPQLSRDHTERMLTLYGAEVETKRRKDGGFRISIHGQPELSAENRQLTIPADPSSAAFLIVAALIIPGSELVIRNICVNPLRTGLFDTLREMNANITILDQRTQDGEEVADIRVKHSALKGTKVPASRAPSMIDEYPILGIAAAFAKGVTTMEGLAELRVKESDRLNAIVKGLGNCGVKVTLEGDKLKIHGDGKQPVGGAHIESNMDHRIAMSYLVMGLAAKEPVTVDEIDCINTSFPGFVEMMMNLGADIAVEEREQDTNTQSPFAAMIQRTVPPLVIAIDGPAASGKGSLARRIADHYGFAYLDTGKLYRAVGLKLVYADIEPDDENAAIEAARNLSTEDLRNPRLQQERIGKAASIVSAMPEVRDALLEYQRKYAQREEGAILDGRDIGTVVCPDAHLKFFITADIDARAKRRHKELQGYGIEVVYDSVKHDLQERDRRDSERATAPLKASSDAISIDTTQMDANTVYEKVVSIIEDRFGQTTSANLKEKQTG